MNWTHVKHNRKLRNLLTMENLVQDLRFGVRILMRDPAVAPIMVSSLALSLVEGLWLAAVQAVWRVGR